jgi:putative transposase
MRKTRGIEVGTVVFAGGRKGFVTGVANFDNIGVRHENQAGITIYKASDLHQSPDPSPDRRFAIDVLTAEQLAIATETRDILQPVLDGEVQGRKALGELIAPHRNRPDLHLSIATAYRRIAAYKATDDISAFLPDRAWKPRAQSKVKQSAAEQAMETAIQRHILCKKPLKYQTIHREMLPAICRALGCDVPPYWTLVRRINEVKRRDPYAVEVAQKGRRVADHHYRQNRGSHPLATGPLSCVQADYWDVHCILVDDATRESVGRPVLCLATCIATGMPYGYYLSYEPPNAGFIGVTLYEGMIPKDQLLSRLGVEMQWPVWGPPRVLQLDNAKDFRGEMISAFCKSRGIDLQHRPVRTPHFGGAIENRFKQLASKIDHLPGATGSNHTTKRGNPSKEAIFTIDEFELYLINLLKEHINTPSKRFGGMTPLQKWNSYFFDPVTGEQKRTIPMPPEDPQALRIELMPFFDRKLTQTGLLLDHIHYDSPQLTAIKKRYATGERIPMRMRRDPRDISYIYVMDPFAKSYIQVPWVTLSREPINLWQHRRLLRILRSHGVKSTEDNQIRAQEDQKHIAEKAKKKTKNMRRDKAKALRGMKMSNAQNPKMLNDPVAASVKAALNATKDPIDAAIAQEDEDNIFKFKL